MLQLPASLLCTLVCLVAPAATEKAEIAAQPARTAPDWLTDGVMYQVWLRGCTPEGTLAAAAKHLPEIAELGVTVVYLSPVMLADDDPRPEFWSPRQQASGTHNPRNPYRIKDYDRVDPEYGTEADLKEFVDTCHRLGMHVLLDVVYHHTGPTCTLLEHPDYFLRDTDGKPRTNQWNFLRLNPASAQLREYFYANMLHWVKDFGVDGFRCDVSGASPLDFWEEARKRLDAVRPDLVILAEDMRRPADQLKAFDVNYSFTWYDTSRKVVADDLPASALRELWTKRRDAFPRGARFIRYTENHDVVNDMRHASVVFSERGAAAMMVVNFTLDGVPFLYNGQEFGDTSPQSLYARWPVNWATAVLPKAAAKRQFTRKLCQLRRSEPILTRGEVVWLDNDRPDEVLSYLRRGEGGEILTVVNLSNRPLSTQVAVDGWSKLAAKPLVADRAKAAVAGDKITVQLGGFGCLVTKKP